MPGLTDAQMAALEAKEAPKKGLTDAEMSALEAQHADSSSPLANLLKNGVGALTALRGGLVKGATLGNLDPSKVGGPDIFKSAMGEHPIASGAGQVAGSLGTGSAIGAGVGAIGPAGSGLASALGRIGLGTGSGALQGYLSKPNEGGDRLHQAKIGAMVAGPLSAAGEVYGALANRGADWTMKQATGIKKDISSAEHSFLNPETNEVESTYRGAGNKLIDMGVRGTKDQMADQVIQHLGDREQSIQDAVADLNSQEASTKIADKLREYGRQFTISGGRVVPNARPDFKQARKLANSYANLGELTPEDVLKINRINKGVGYRASGVPATTTQAELAQQAARTTRDMLTKQNPEIMDILGDQQALVLAKKGLINPSNVQSGPITSLFFHKTGPAVGSYGATALQKSGEAASSPEVQQAILGSLFGATRDQK